MRSNPLEPRIPETPPWAIYAQGQYDWKPSAGVYLTPVWDIAAQYAGGHALAESGVSAQGVVTVEIPIIIGVNTERLPIITDPDAAFVLNEMYNAFRRETRENIWKNVGELTTNNLAEVADLSAASWMTNIDGLWPLFYSFVEENPDVLKPLKMISQFAGAEVAVNWLNETSIRRGHPVNVFYSPLPDEFIRYATQMYMCSQEIGWDQVAAISSMTLQNNKPLKTALWNQDSSRFDSLMYHGTTLKAALAAFPELENTLSENDLQKIRIFWEQQTIKTDLEEGKVWQQMMAGLAEQYGSD